MAINSAVFNQERSNTAITFTNADGTKVTMTFDEYEKMKRAKARAKAKAAKKTKPTKTSVELNKEQAIGLIKNVKVIKSLCAYYDHGYRQWGNVCKKEIIQNPIISPSFMKFRSLCRDLDKQIALVDGEGKNSKDTYQLIEKLSYIVDDISRELNSLSMAIRNSRVCEIYKKHEMIFGEDRRLGLAILCQRTMLALLNMQNIFKEINQISVDGADIVEYKLEGGSFNRF